MKVKYIFDYFLYPDVHSCTSDIFMNIQPCTMYCNFSKVINQIYCFLVTGHI